MQHRADGGDGRAHGGACVSGSGSAAVGGGISEARALLFEHLCRLPEPGGSHRDAGSAARQRGSEHKHGARSAAAGCYLCTTLAAVNAHVHLHLCVREGVVAHGGGAGVSRGAGG